MDDISEMSPEMQSFLLRFLDDGLITPANREESIHVDVRIIATAGSELINRVNSGSFRMDLYYRLNVLRLDLPPLRERLDDLEKLSNYFASILSARCGKNVYSVTPETLELFRGYAWPGNLRESCGTSSSAAS
ncbi:MAG: sigma 54-interacting transcriptional regulator [Lachnospiraceae bacterium]